MATMQSPRGNDKSLPEKDWKFTIATEIIKSMKDECDESTTSIMTNDDDSYSLLHAASCSSLEQETAVAKQQEQSVARLVARAEACKKLDSTQLTRCDHKATNSAGLSMSTKYRPHKKVRHVGLVNQTLPREHGQPFFVSSKHENTGGIGRRNMSYAAQLRMSESAPALSLAAAAAAAMKRKNMLPSLSSQANATFLTTETPPAANNILSGTVAVARKRKNLPSSLSSQANATLFNTAAPPAAQSDAPKPHEYLTSLLQQEGLPTRTYAALDLKSFFHPVTEESVQAYDHAMAIAIRKEDLETLSDMKSAGRTMQCGNKFGETVVHTACRRGSVAVLRFLLDAGVNPAVCCDAGRTPLHDACWTAEPNFDVVRILLTVLPDLLYVTDKRGLPPLAYVPTRQWSSWREFLKSYQNNNELKGLQPRHLSG